MGRESDFKTFVVDLASVLQRCSKTGDIGHGHFKKHIGCVTVVEVDFEAEHVVENAEFKTEVGHGSLFPAKVVIADRGGVDARHEIAVAGAENIVVGAKQGVCVVVADAEITRLAVAGADFQCAEPCLFLEEVFFGKVPAHRCRREVAPFVVGAEARRAVGAQRGGYEVFVVEVVLCAGDKRGEGPGLTGRIPDCGCR